MTDDIGTPMGRREYDHREPCGLLQSLTTLVNVHDKDIDLLFKRVDRLPNWMVFLFSATTGTLGAALTAIYFLIARLSK